MGEPRPTNPTPDQSTQAALLRDTGNGPTVGAEADVLAAEFGEPDQRGVYGATAEDGGTAE